MNKKRILVIVILIAALLVIGAVTLNQREVPDSNTKSKETTFYGADNTKNIENAVDEKEPDDSEEVTLDISNLFDDDADNEETHNADNSKNSEEKSENKTGDSTMLEEADKENADSEKWGEFY